MVGCDAAVFCVAGVAFGDIDVTSAWQAWDTSTLLLLGRCGIEMTQKTAHDGHDGHSFWIQSSDKATKMMILGPVAQLQRILEL